MLLDVDLFADVRIRHGVPSTRRAKPSRGAHTCQHRFQRRSKAGGEDAAGRAPESPGPGQGLLSLDLADVGGLEPLRTPTHLELDPVTLGQTLESGSLNGAEVHEHILATLLRDETEPLRIVEPLHAALSHLYLPLSREACASVMPHHHGGGALLDRKANKNAAGLEVLTALISNLANLCSLRIRLPVNPKPDQRVSHDGRAVKECYGWCYCYMKMSWGNCSVKMSSPYGDFHDEPEGSAPRRSGHRGLGRPHQQSRRRH